MARGKTPKPGDPTLADLSRLKRMVSEAQSLNAEARLDSLKDQDYYDGYQWTADELRVLRKRKQPTIVINRVRAAINGILGVTEQGKSEPRAYPRTPNDEDSADVVTDVLRYIADKNRFSRLKQDCFTDMLIPGTMAALVGADADLNVTIEQIRWEEFFADPKSRRRDFSDARYMGIAKWMYIDDASALYPDKEVSLDQIGDGGLVSDLSFQDRPDSIQMAWVDRRQRRIMVVEMYYREGHAWLRCVFTAGTILADPSPSPYHDEKGRPINPIEAHSAYVDRQNTRYGIVRDMRGPQDEINKRRSKLLHHVSSRQIQPVDGMAVMTSADDARAEAARPDGVMPPGYQVVPTNDMTNGQIQLLQEAKGEMERMAPNPAMVGRQGGDPSGRALMARSQAGLTELAVIYGSLEDWELRIYRQCWARAKQYWKAPMFIRVTDDEDAPKFVGLNQPRGAPMLVPGPDGQPQMDPQTGGPVIGEGPPQFHPPTTDDSQPHPYAGHPVLGYKNPVAEMDVDITLESMPNVANIQQEQFQDLVQLVGSNPVYAQEVPFEVLLGLSAVPHKRALIDQLKAYREQSQQAQAAQAQQQQQIQGTVLQSKLAETQSKTDLNSASADHKRAQSILDIHAAGQASVPTSDIDAKLAHDHALNLIWKGHMLPQTQAAAQAAAETQARYQAAELAGQAPAQAGG